MWIERLLGTAPVPVPPHVFYLDGRQLAYACFQRTEGGAGFRLRDYHTVDLGPDTFQSGLLGGPIRDIKEFGETLAGLLRRAPEPVGAASLVLPDHWLRVVFTEIGELPQDSSGRDELIRWKLKRLVPFRVEDLRIEAVEVSPLSHQEEPRRLLLGFLLEVLAAQLEAVFEQEGVRLGRISCASLSLLSAIEGIEDEAMAALVAVRDDGYTLLFARRGEPVLLRFKPSPGEVPIEARQRLVSRDLRLSCSYLEEQFPGVSVSGALLLAPPDLEGSWLDWTEEGLGTQAQSLGTAHLPQLEIPGAAQGPLNEMVPMFGACRLEVS